MNLTQQIDKHLTQAIKQRNELVVLTMRSLKSAIKNAEIAKKPKELEHSDVIAVLRSEVKKRKEAAQDYTKGNRQELADKELKEVEVLQKYLPPEMSDEKLREVVKKVVEKTGAAGPQDFGKVMGAVMGELKGQADGKKVGEIVREMLAHNSPKASFT